MSAFGDQLRGKWNRVKGEMKQRYGYLTDDDLTYQEGREDEWLGRIQERTGETKESLMRWINNL